MKDSYSDQNQIMLCFVQGFGDSERGFNKNRELSDFSVPESNVKFTKKTKRVSLQIDVNAANSQSIESKTKKSEALVTGKSLKLSSGGRFPEVKRSLSDRFSVITDVSGRRPVKGLLTIRKTW